MPPSSTQPSHRRSWTSHQRLWLLCGSFNWPRPARGVAASELEFVFFPSFIFFFIVAFFVGVGFRACSGGWGKTGRPWNWTCFRGFFSGGLSVRCYGSMTGGICGILKIGWGQGKCFEMVVITNQDVITFLAKTHFVIELFLLFKKSAIFFYENTSKNIIVVNWNKRQKAYL